MKIKYKSKSFWQTKALRFFYAEMFEKCHKISDK